MKEQNANYQAQILRISRRNSVFLRGTDNTWMSLPLNELKEGMNFEEKFVQSLVTGIKHNKCTIQGLEHELSTFSAQVKEMTNNIRK